LSAPINTVKGDANTEAIDVAKVGLSTKIHAVVEAKNPVSFHLTPGQACDLDGADVLLPDLKLTLC